MYCRVLQQYLWVLVPQQNNGVEFGCLEGWLRLQLNPGLQLFCLSTYPVQYCTLITERTIRTD